MKKVLYFGLDPTRFCSDGQLTHFPLIEIEPLNDYHLALESLYMYSSFIFTSRQTIHILWKNLSEIQKEFLKNATHLCVGKATQELLEEKGMIDILTAQKEHAEGVVELLNKCSKRESYFFPHSQRARGVIHQALFSKGCRFYAFPMYRPIYTKKEKINWKDFDELIFTSPSTVKAFQYLYQENPPTCSRALGPVTQELLDQITKKSKPVLK